MLYKSNAKINLGLRILEKREDGYHNLESIFLPIPWYDELEVSKSDIFELQLEGNKIEGDLEDNLCFKAYDAMRNLYPISAVKISLKKSIPSGAGLGGGSSNASFVLIAINEIFNLKIDDIELMKIADSIGSDCSFFIKNKAAIVRGKGEIVEEIDISLNDYILIINPGLHISTKEAFSSIKPNRDRDSIKDFTRIPKYDWQDLLVNDFEKVMLSKYPELENLKSSLKDLGSYYVSMSGSGSTFFALFENEPKLSTNFFPNYLKRVYKLDL